MIDRLKFVYENSNAPKLNLVGRQSLFVPNIGENCELFSTVICFLLVNNVETRNV